MTALFILFFVLLDRICLWPKNNVVFRLMCTRVFIGRLSHRASERDVEDFFRGYGRIRDIVLKNGFGFVVSLKSIDFVEI